MPYRPAYTCLCPFYDREFRKGICCEGIDAAAANTMMFESEAAKMEYIRQNCVHENPKNCKLFDILAEKYLETD